jgi:hypothetical protein
MIRLMSKPDMKRYSPDPVCSFSVMRGAGPSPRAAQLKRLKGHAAPVKGSEEKSGINRF